MSHKQPSRTNEAIEILSATNDGNELANDDLHLLESAVNSNLTEEGVTIFDELYRQVTADTYKRPYLYDVPGLTQDLDGYVLWKETYVVEHYSIPRNKAVAERLRTDAIELARRCQRLEELNITPSIAAVLNDELFA